MLPHYHQLGEVLVPYSVTLDTQGESHHCSGWSVGSSDPPVGLHGNVLAVRSRTIPHVAALTSWQGWPLLLGGGESFESILGLL